MCWACCCYLFYEGGARLLVVVLCACGFEDRGLINASRLGLEPWWMVVSFVRGGGWGRGKKNGKEG